MNIALSGGLPISEPGNQNCTWHGDGPIITVELIVEAINNALHGCRSFWLGRGDSDTSPQSAY